jgi:uncharacterized membrane protein
MEKKMTQQEINEQEWKNPNNWSESLVGFYFSKRDSRVWVPKSIPWMGWTLNLAKPAGARWMLGFLAGIPLLTVLIIVLSVGK